MSRSHARRQGLAIALLAGMAGCDTASLPMAPSELTSGVSLWEHADFQGNSALLTESEANLANFSGPCAHDDGNTTIHDWNDCVSSVRVAPGWRAIIYRDDDYDGQSVELTADAPNLQLVPGSCSHDGLNDCVTSVKVIAPGRAF
jgi:Peptidase inhibitor family I36